MAAVTLSLFTVLLGLHCFALSTFFPKSLSLSSSFPLMRMLYCERIL